MLVSFSLVLIDLNWRIVGAGRLVAKTWILVPEVAAAAMAVPMQLWFRSSAAFIPSSCFIFYSVTVVTFSLTQSVWSNAIERQGDGVWIGPDSGAWIV